MAAFHLRRLQWRFSPLNRCKYEQRVSESPLSQEYLCPNHVIWNLNLARVWYDWETCNKQKHTGNKFSTQLCLLDNKKNVMEDIYHKSQCASHDDQPSLSLLPAAGCRMMSASTLRWWHLFFWSCCATSLCSSWFWSRSDRWGSVSAQQTAAALCMTWGRWPASPSCWVWRGRWLSFPSGRPDWPCCTCSPSSTLCRVNMSCRWCCTALVTGEWVIFCHICHSVSGMMSATLTSTDRRAIFTVYLIGFKMISSSLWESFLDFKKTCKNEVFFFEKLYACEVTGTLKSSAKDNILMLN